MTVRFRKAHATVVDSALFEAINSLKGHIGLPRAYFEICGLYPVIDEGLVYEKVLREEC